MRCKQMMWTLVLATLLTSTLAMAADNPAVGRWDLTIMVSTSEKDPSWLEIRQENGKFVGQFCGVVSGVHSIGEVKIEGNKISFKSHDNANPDASYSGTIKNNTINGMRTLEKDLQIGGKKGTKHPFIGLKFMPITDVRGEWKMKLGDDKADLNLQQVEKGIIGKLSGKYAGEVTKGSAQGNHLILTIKKGENPCKIEAQAKGDAMEGTLEPADGKPIKFTANRERKWGEPIKLFNGKNLDGWETMNPPGEKADNNWAAVDNVLVNSKSGKNIRTKRADFKNFKLHVEFRVPPKGNSGVYLRGRYEIQVKDSADKPLSGDSCGALYSRIVPATNAAKPANEWQTFDITLINQYVIVVLNGKTIIDNQEVPGITGGAIDSNEFGPGPIYFQGDHGKIEYRNIVLTPAQ